MRVDGSWLVDAKHFYVGYIIIEAKKGYHREPFFTREDIGARVAADACAVVAFERQECLRILVSVKPTTTF